jgi:hypothetical protein
MLHFRSAEDLQQLSPGDPSYAVVADLVQRLLVAEGYDPDADGWLILVEAGDTDRVLTELWDDRRLVDIPWEGITREGDCFLAVFLANNQFGLAFLIPDAHWVNGDLRRVIEHNLEY